MIPGLYDNVIVALDQRNKIITGFFSASSADDSRPLMRCEFYFSGRLTGSTTKLKIHQLTLAGEATSGSLGIKQNGKESTLSLQLDEEQPGCMNIYPKAELATTTLALVAPASWIEIRMAAGKKVYFFKNIAPEEKTRIYITKGDAVGVLEYSGEWAKVAYVRETKSTVGWVKVSQLFPSVKGSAGLSE